MRIRRTCVLEGLVLAGAASMVTVAQEPPWIEREDLVINSPAPTSAEVPGSPWPVWLLLDDGIQPVTPTLPPKGQGQAPPIEAKIDGTGLDPDTYTGWIRYRSDLSGAQPYEVTRKVYFDHCREVFQDPDLPEQTVMLDRGASREWTLTATPTGGTVISDVDVIVDPMVDLLPVEPLVEITLTSLTSDGITVVLKAEDGGFQPVYDEETERPAFGGLENFESRHSNGDWVLKIDHKSYSPVSSITFDFNRFHVRLHHELAPPCE